MPRTILTKDNLKPLVESGIKDSIIAEMLNVKTISVYFARKRLCIHREPIRGGKTIPTLRQLSILTGTMLGDGSLSLTNTNPWGKIEHCMVQFDYTKWLYQELEGLVGKLSTSERFDKRTGKTTYNVRFHINANPALHEIYHELYQTGKKQITKRFLKNYNALSLAVHYMDDGFKNVNGGCYISTNSFSIESIKLLRHHLFNMFKAHTSVHKGNLLYIKKSSVHNFNNLIKPYMHETMLYKIASRNPVNSVKALTNNVEGNTEPSHPREGMEGATTKCTSQANGDGSAGHFNSEDIV